MGSLSLQRQPARWPVAAPRGTPIAALHASAQADANQETAMQQEKLNPQKPGITQPHDPKHEPHPRQPQRKGGTAEQQPPRQPDDQDKRRQVPIEGE
jgi:hypothetical protein